VYSTTRRPMPSARRSPSDGNDEATTSKRRRKTREDVGVQRHGRETPSAGSSHHVNGMAMPTMAA